jgi:hypothetical protein
MKAATESTRIAVCTDSTTAGSATCTGVQRTATVVAAYVYVALQHDGSSREQD